MTYLLHECKISITQFSYGLFMSSLKSQLSSTKMMMTITNNDTNDSKDNDYQSVQWMFFQSALLTYSRPTRLVSLRHGCIYHRRQDVWFLLPSFCSIFKILFTLHLDTSLGIVNKCINLQAGTACQQNDRWNTEELKKIVF